MKKILNTGNLPKIFQIFLKEMRGCKETIIYECSTTNELEQLARDQKCELKCTLDSTTKKGFLIGFDVAEPKSGIILTGTDSLSLIIYFKELSIADFKRYNKMLSKHLNQSQEAMFDRRDRRKQAIKNAESRKK